MPGWLQGIVGRGRELYKAIRVDLREVDINIDDFPLPKPNLAVESDGPLYESRRDYLGQLGAYKAHQHGDTP